MNLPRYPPNSNPMKTEFEKIQEFGPQSRSLPFRMEVACASGGAEVYSHTDPNTKFIHFGWRCTNAESLYSNKTLLGNWNEECFDLDEIKQSRPLPSQYDHYYQSTNAAAYNTTPKHTIQHDVFMYKGRLPRAFSCLQPELDSDQQKALCGAWQTTTGAAFRHPDSFYYPINPFVPLPAIKSAEAATTNVSSVAACPPCEGPAECPEHPELCCPDTPDVSDKPAAPAHETADTSACERRFTRPQYPNC